MYGESRHQGTISDAHWHGALFIVAVALLACPARVLRADEVYKSVDSAGNVVYSDRADASAAQQSVVRIEDARNPPDVIHFCWTNCFTLSYDNGLYRRTDGSDETWTVERYTSRSLILRRHDAPAAWNGFSSDVIYQGQVSNDRLIGVTVNGSPVPDIHAAWGVALDTLPGSNAERDQRLKMQAIYASNAPPADIDPAAEGGDMRTAEAPPPLLNDEQPPCAVEGYLWTPGYWAWSGGGYYWVPGAWVQPPRAGVLWTPGYWGYAGTVYVFHRGYWGPHIGFYGGINYGYGYTGVGFAGGRWVGNTFAYNRTVSNVDVSVIHNTYNESVVNNVTLNKVSYNGGPGGTRAAAAEPHIPSTPSQRQPTPKEASNPALVAQASGAHSAVPPNTTAHAQVAAVQPSAPKSAGAAPTKPPPHPTRAERER